MIICQRTSCSLWCLLARESWCWPFVLFIVLCCTFRPDLSYKLIRQQHTSFSNPRFRNCELPTFLTSAPRRCNLTSSSRFSSLHLEMEVLLHKKPSAPSSYQLLYFRSSSFLPFFLIGAGLCPSSKSFLEEEVFPFLSFLFMQCCTWRRRRRRRRRRRAFAV